MFSSGQNYRDFLKATLTEKQKGNSLTAFSKKLGLSTSFLSEVLNNKKSLSVEMALRIAMKLGLTESETQYFCLLTQLEQEKDAELREEILRRLGSLNPNRPTHDLSLDLFKVIAEWHHFAILEMTHISGFKFGATALAQKLGISKMEAEVAIERLERLELLEQDSKGRYRKAHNYLLSESKAPNAALKQYHRGILEKALESLNSQTPKERMSSTDILPIDSRYLKDVDKLSQEFSSAVFRLAEKSSVKDSVYALSVHFLKLNKEGTST
jgi:uncharacterized protein (TIGR02147 family)